MEKLYIKLTILLTSLILIFLTSCKTMEYQLNEALQNNNSEKARALIESGTDINLVTIEGWSPLMMALRYEQPENARLLLE
ncbi:MAG: ankyrin repeat domain-containing protein [Spirochaetaceae bacterium]|jgi:ankyrin repeat protein|nr:ankyrin repeat domain-containing protein [Spirochaetaceae bacterium]